MRWVRDNNFSNREQVTRLFYSFRINNQVIILPKVVLEEEKKNPAKYTE